MLQWTDIKCSFCPRSFGSSDLALCLLCSSLLCIGSGRCGRKECDKRTLPRSCCRHAAKCGEKHAFASLKALSLALSVDMCSTLYFVSLLYQINRNTSLGQGNANKLVAMVRAAATGKNMHKLSAQVHYLTYLLFQEAGDLTEACSQFQTFP